MKTFGYFVFLSAVVCGGWMLLAPRGDEHVFAGPVLILTGVVCALLATFCKHD